MYIIQHCFIYCPSLSTVSEDALIKPRTVATLALTARRSNHIHRKISFSIFLSPPGMSLTKLSLVGNYDVIYKLFLPRESLISDIPAGDGNIDKLFYGVVSSYM